MFLNKIVYRYVFNIKLNNKVLCLKYLLFYVFFIRFFLINSSVFSFNFYINKLRSSLNVITKAPYRYKLSKHQFSVQRTQLIFVFSYKINTLRPLNIKLFAKFRHYLVSFDFCFFHLNVCYAQHIFAFREWVK